MGRNSTDAKHVVLEYVATINLRQKFGDLEMEIDLSTNLQAWLRHGDKDVKSAIYNHILTNSTLF